MARRANFAMENEGIPAFGDVTISPKEGHPPSAFPSLPSLVSRISKVCPSMVCLMGTIYNTVATKKEKKASNDGGSGYLGALLLYPLLAHCALYRHHLQTQRGTWKGVLAFLRLLFL